jgi:hypothetical protein
MKKDHWDWNVSAKRFSLCLLISCMVKPWHPDKPSFTAEQSTSYVCWNSLEKMSCRLLGSAWILEILHQVLLNVLGRQSAGIWRFTPEGSCWTWGHVSLVRTEGAWAAGWAEMGLDAYSSIVPGQAGASCRLPTLSVLWKYLKSGLLPRLPSPLLRMRLSCFSESFHIKPLLIGFLSFDIEM